MVRRLVLLVLVLLGAYVGTQAMAEVLPERGAALAERGLLVLFGILFAWISAGFWTGADGRRRAPLRPRQEPARCAASPSEPVRPLDPAARTAIVMPICNEHVPTVFGGLAATIDSLVSTGESENFDVYVLSDTTDPDIRAAEHAAWTELAGRIAAASEGEARRCACTTAGASSRVKRKAGNVADFCRRWGAAYRYFVVLDADSVMTGECLTTLVRLMEAHPDAGIIQTAPRAVGHETLHGARPAVLGARLRAALHRRHALLAARRIALLGPQRHPAHGAVHGALRRSRRCPATGRSRAR